MKATDLSTYTAMRDFPLYKELRAEWKGLASHGIRLTEWTLKKIIKSSEGIIADTCEFLRSVNAPDVGRRSAIRLVEEGTELILVLPEDQTSAPTFHLYSKEPSPNQKIVCKVLDNTFLHLHAEFGELCHHA